MVRNYAFLFHVIDTHEIGNIMKNQPFATIGRILLVLAPLLVFNTAFAGWELLQNSPTTNDLHSVFFLNDSTGWIAGDNSTIFKTTNSGATWMQQTSPEASNFQCITFVNADTGWACGTGGTVIKTTNGGTNWISQTFTGSKFNSMDFIDANTGYICGDNGIIWKTADGGGNWVNQPSGIIQNLHQIKFEDATTGFAVGDYAYILKTSTGGNSWQIKNGPSIGGQIFYTFDVVYSHPNFCILSTGTFTRYSTDDGESWRLGDFPAEAINSITYLQHDSTYFGVGTNGYIARTINHGTNFTQEQSPTTQTLYSGCHPDISNFIWAVGANGTILKNIPAWNYLSIGIASMRWQDMKFINQDTGWVVGYGKNNGDGYIAKTTNSGTDWLTQTFDPGLFSVFFTDANTGYVIGTNGTILKTIDGGTTLDTLFSDPSKLLYSVYFTDANTGYTVGEDNTILKTTNGGTNWNPLSSGSAQYQWFRGVYFTDTNTGYVVGFNGSIFKTINSGTTWDTLSSGTTKFLCSIYFVDANIGYIVGDSGAIIKTTNGGTNWETLSSGNTQWLRSVYFIDASLGYVVGGTSIYRTSNGGSNWFEDEIPPISVSTMSAVQFAVKNNTVVGFAVGDRILRTSFEYFGGEPGGNSGRYPGWVQVNSGTTGHLRGVDYVDPFVAFAVGDPPFDFFVTEKGMILRTINGGQTWTRQQSHDTTSFLTDVSFADVNNGIAVGWKGVILHTTNSGTDWVQQSSGTTNTLDAVDMLDLNNAFACGGCSIIGCGNTNTLLHTSNGGVTWETQTNGTSGYWWDIDYINSTTATAVGTQGRIIRTTNAGLSWFPQTGGRNLNLGGVQFIDVNNGIAISYNGPVLRTTDGGTNWVQTDSLMSGYKISYIDSNNAFIVSPLPDGTSLIYRTTNGGLNWTLQDTIETPIYAVSFADANNGLITGTGGMILRTSNAGVFSGTNNAHNRNGLNLPIGDFQNADDSINVNVTGNSRAYAVSNGYIVTGVYLTIDTVLHTNDGDLEFYLEHNGIIDTLIYRNGGSGSNFLGTFLNDATNFPLVSGTAPFRGSFKPYRPLSRFCGQDPNGAWRLRIYDRASGNTGTLEAWSLTVKYTYQTLTGVTEDPAIPSQYQLSQNYPNPFNPTTTVRYQLPERMLVTIKIFNILGQEVAILVNEEKAAGSYEINFNASKLSSGVYFYRIQAGNFITAKKMLLLR